MNVTVQPSFMVPGMGMVSTQGGGFSGGRSQSLMALPQRTPQSGVFPPITPGQEIPAAYKQRALLAAPGTGAEAERVIAAAKTYGLNQVWIDVDVTGAGEKPDAAKTVLSAAIASGKKAGIAVGAVLRLLRVPTKGEGTLPPDRNIVGETTTEFAVRRAAAPLNPSPTFFPGMTAAEESASLLRRGDWLLPDAPAVRASVLKRASALAQTPGLAGIVLRDAAAPGYEGAGASNAFPRFSTDGAEQMGYTEPMRLAFLRETALDPIDLSTLPQGRVSLPFGVSFSSLIDMKLPFFPDYGPNPETQSINDQTATELGAKAGFSQWKQFCAAQSDAVVQTALRAIRTGQPTLPVWVQTGPDMNVIGVSFFDTADAKAAPPAPAIPPAGRSMELPHSPEALYTVRCLPLTDNAKSVESADPSNPLNKSLAERDFSRRLLGIASRPVPGWDGFVIDLTEAGSLDRALPLLEILPKAQ